MGVCIALAEHLGYKLAAVVPGGEVGKIGLDHFGCVLELGLCEAFRCSAGRGDVFRRGQPFDLRHDESSIAPGMKIAAVRV